MPQLEHTYITITTPNVEEYLTISAFYDPQDRAIESQSVQVIRETHFDYDGKKGIEKTDMRDAYKEPTIIALLVASVDWHSLYADYLESQEQAVTDSQEDN